MKEKKNIDRLFQEKLRDFESTPDNQVWLNIQAELNKDNNRKIIPWWLQYSGIAAVFLIGLFLLNKNHFFDFKTENSIVLDAKISKDVLNKKHITQQKETKITSNSKVNYPTKTQIINPNFSKSIAKDEKNISPYHSSDYLTEKKKNQNNAHVLLSKNNLPIKQSAIHETNNSPITIGDKINATNSIATSQNSNEVKNETKPIEDSKKQSSIYLATSNELEGLLKNKLDQKNVVVATSKNKWKITPNVGQVYQNASSGGSPIDKQLSVYEKKSDKSISYGIGLQYAVTNKIVLRTGINKLVMGYNTNNVLYSAGLTANNLTNINYFPNNTLKILNETNYNAMPSFEKQIQKTNTGTLNQKMGYYELPLELSYALVDKKIGVNIIGGFSTLFLNENMISVVSSQSNMELGEAKNLNQIHFSTNVGLGFKYQLIKSFQLNLEPVLKYQHKTFTSDSNNFSPIYIGLYSGISYQF